MEASLDRAMLLLNQSRFELAEAELRRSLADDPDNPLGHAFLAVCLAERKDKAAAQEEARLAIHLAPDLPFAHYVLAKILFQQDRHDEAEASAREAIRLDPSDADAFALLAAIRFDRRQWKEALAAAEEGLSRDAEHLDCANLRAMALVKLNRPRDAFETIEGALARDPENALSHANRGWTSLEQGDHAAALGSFREALRIDPELEWARMGMVEALKARHLLYRLMLRYFLWMSKQSRSSQWILILGLVVGRRALRMLAEAVPALRPVVVPVLVLLFVFVYLTWVADPLFNLLLRLNRFGKYALSREQRVASNWVGACALGAMASLAAWGGFWATGSSLRLLGFAGTVYFAALILPVAGTFAVPSGTPRALMALYTMALAAIGPACVALVVMGDRPHLWTVAMGLIMAFFVGVAASTWVGIFLGRTR
jgi:Tfp pilus assembly protein PilF